MYIYDIDDKTQDIKPETRHHYKIKDVNYITFGKLGEQDDYRLVIFIDAKSQGLND